MAVRPIVKTGVALASAGLLLAATPAIAPPLPPRASEVVAEVQNTAFSDVIDAFIAGGSLQSLLVALAGCDSVDCEDDPVVNGFINGGTLQAILALGADDPVVAAFIEGGALQAAIAALADEDNPVVGGLIEGGPLQAAIVGLAGCEETDCSGDDDDAVAGGLIAGGTLQAILALGADDPVVAAFIEGGALQAAIVALADEDDAVVGGLIEGGPLQAAIVALAGCGTPDCAESEDGTIPAVPFAQGFISGGSIEAVLTSLSSATSTLSLTTLNEAGPAEGAPIQNTVASPGEAGLAVPSTNDNATVLGGTRAFGAAPVFSGAPRVFQPPAPIAPSAGLLEKRVASPGPLSGEAKTGTDDVADTIKRGNKFKPEPIIPFGSKSNGDAGGPMGPLTAAIQRLTGGGQTTATPGGGGAGEGDSEE